MDLGKPVTTTSTCRCGAVVTVTGTIGPCHICDACAAELLAVIWGGPVTESTEQREGTS